MDKFKEFFYLVEDDDLSSFTTNNKLSVKHIESRIRYSIKYTTTIREDTLNNPDLEREITIESINVQDGPKMITCTHRKYLQKFIDEAPFEMINEFFNTKMNESIKLQIRIYTSQIVMGEDYKEQIFRKLSMNEMLLVLTGMN